MHRIVIVGGGAGGLELATKLGVPGRSKMQKDELVAAVRAARQRKAA